MKNNALDNAITLIYNKSKNDNIPHVRAATMDFIINFVINHNYTKILEIGTAYGYSAAMLAAHTNAQIESIEKACERYQIASTFLHDFKQIKLHNIDCHEFNTENKFDLIFIDGPKAKQIALVEQYSQYLTATGSIIIDNMFMHKFNDDSNLTKNQTKLKLAIHALHEYLLQQTKFNYELIKIDDGVAVLTWKKQCN